MPPRTTGAFAKQYGLLLVQYEAFYAQYRQLQHLERRTVEMEKLSADFAD